MKIASKRPAAALAAWGLLTLTPVASAHDVWLTFAGPADERRVIVNYGHPDDRPPAFADKIVDLVAIKGNVRTSLLKDLAQAQLGAIIVARSQPFSDDGHVIVAARYDNGFWVRNNDGTSRNVTRRFARDAAESLWSGKFAKAVSGPGAPWQIVMNHDLEIVPLSDPAATKPGETLRVRVMFHGKPLAKAEVERGDGTAVIEEKDIPRFTTGNDGVADVPIVKRGAHLLVIDHRVSPSAAPDQANQDLFNATLWFEIADRP